MNDIWQKQIETTIESDYLYRHLNEYVVSTQNDEKKESLTEWFFLFLVLCLHSFINSECRVDVIDFPDGRWLDHFRSLFAGNYFRLRTDCATLTTTINVILLSYDSKQQPS